MSSEPVFLSLVMPVYNESLRLARPLQLVGEYLALQDYSSEIIIVDDGSSDGTHEIARETAEHLAVPVRYLRYKANRGKGHALKVGFEAARGRYIVFSDADLSTPIEETARLLEPLREGADIAIGTRKSSESNVKIHQPRFRELSGKAFTFIVQFLLVRVSDVTCGFKAFHAHVGKDLFARARIFDWSFDAEVLFLARKLRHEVVEIPVTWEDRPGTKVNILRDATMSFIGIVRIRANWALGRYETTVPTDYQELWTRPQTSPHSSKSGAEPS